MTITREIANLSAEARNCRRLASMTFDPSAKAYLERLADRHDSEREEMEALKASGIEHQAAKSSGLSLDRIGAIPIIENEDAILIA